MIDRFDAAPHPDARARNRRARRLERARLAHLSSGSALDARPRARPRVARAMAPPTPTVPQRVLVGDDARALLELIEETVRVGGDAEGAVERRRAYVRARAERSGKAPLHLAAWRGSPDVVRALLDDPCRADIDQISTGRHNYGKTAIFLRAHALEVRPCRASDGTPFARASRMRFSATDARENVAGTTSSRISWREGQR